ncbi:hypothetical protein DCAR_0103275 [Daucus carota subsp. sativus]|uniref:DUF7086 domain-containing protein n=1 Tax=Daucus carota subsp. sativus TaxID=79200 RepID=A0A166HVL5_DAUCS|nr:hypothetical protein DCAR_0103275 [Daucus carota subsp. sativus]
MSNNQQQEISRKRKSTKSKEADNVALTLSPPASQPQPPPRRRNATKSQDIPPPYPWATTKRAITHTLDHLDALQIKTISGQVQCKKCERQYDMELDLHAKFIEIASFIAKNKTNMHDRAPANLMNPVLPACKFCHQDNSVKPVISDKKKSINWLFLLLGQMLGCCTLEQLKYFCKHTKNHRTGAKDRVLYLTYLAICKQLDPKGPFDR